MTKSSIPAAPEPTAGAGAPEREEIEVTPEMVRAGVVAYWEHDERFEDIETGVRRIYLAMALARREAE